MPKKRVHKGNILRSYEWTNLLFFLLLIVALGVFVAIVFRIYSTPEESPAKSEDGILSEIVAPGSDICIFYVGSRLTDVSRKYQSRLQIPPTDDGLVKGLFDIPGVIGVTIDQRMVMISKSPEARWEAIQPGAREVIRNHLHLHQ